MLYSSVVKTYRIMLNNRNKESILVSETKNHKAIFSRRQAQSFTQ